VVLNNEVISAYERSPLAVIGDASSSIRKLLQKKQVYFVQTGRDTVINMTDFRISNRLKRQGLSMDYVPTRGQHIVLLDNANLSSGGDAVDVTRSMHDSFRRLATDLTRDMGLRFCGVDLIVAKGTIEQTCGDYYILEINAAPGLDHYAELGRLQKRAVDGLYLKVLQAMSGLPEGLSGPARGLRSPRAWPVQAPLGRVLCLFSSQTPGPRVTDNHPAIRDNRNLIDAARSVPVSQDGPRGCPKPIFRDL
jgi:hypothetical protein